MGIGKYSLILLLFNSFFMKKIIPFLLSLSLSFSAFAQKDAIDYNDIIVGEQTKIGKEINDFVISEQPDEVDLNYKILLEQIDASINVVENLGAWQDDATLQKSTLELFGFYKTVSLNEYKEFKTFMKKPDSEITNSDITYLQTLEKGIQEKEKKFDDDFAASQDAFAKRWGFTLE